MHKRLGKARFIKSLVGEKVTKFFIQLGVGSNHMKHLCIEKTCIFGVNPMSKMSKKVHKS